MLSHRRMIWISHRHFWAKCGSTVLGMSTLTDPKGRLLRSNTLIPLETFLHFSRLSNQFTIMELKDCSMIPNSSGQLCRYDHRPSAPEWLTVKWRLQAPDMAHGWRIWFLCWQYSAVSSLVTNHRVLWNVRRYLGFTISSVRDPTLVSKNSYPLLESVWNSHGKQLMLVGLQGLKRNGIWIINCHS